MVAVNVIVLLSHAGFLLVVNAVVVPGCPRTARATSIQHPATSNSFLIPDLLFKLRKAVSGLPAISSSNLFNILNYLKEKVKSGFNFSIIT
jgi:hypothetical protein